VTKGVTYGVTQPAASVEQLRAGGGGSALNFARQLPNALSEMPSASQYSRWFKSLRRQAS
jgi:hypothetical protein